MRTVRDRLPDGQFAEMGATRFADTHQHVLGYAHEFGLPLRELKSSARTLFRLRERTFFHAEGEPWPADVLTLSPEERCLSVQELLRRGTSRATFGDPFDQLWPSGTALEQDDQSFMEYLRRIGVSEDARLLVRTAHGACLDTGSALSWCRDLAINRPRERMLAICHGNDALTDALTRGLLDVMHLRSPVVAVTQSRDEVEVTCFLSNVRTTFTADFVICALPPVPMRRIHWDTITGDKRDALRDLKMMPAARAYLRTSSRSWTELGLDGLVLCCTDSPIGRVWDMTHGQDGLDGILMAYMENANAEAFSRVPYGRRLEYVREHMRAALPELEDHVVGGFHKSWQEDPWAGGGWAQFEAGELTTLYPAVRR